MSEYVPYSAELGHIICERIANGESLRKICSEPGMPARMSVFRWLRTKGDFAEEYADARQMQGDYMDDLILETAYECTPENARAASVKISSFQWRAMKLRPREYGERKSVELSGPDRAPLTSVNINTTDPVEASRVYQAIISGK
jgi:hypothetical protein